jgi:hypothetical protein
MKKVILLLSVLPYMAFSQISDNFESGDLSSWTESIRGHWMSDSVSSISGKYSLHHSYDNPESGTDEIGMPLGDLKPSMGTTKWSFRVRHGYDPSSSNNWSVFLCASNGPGEMHPGGDISGFAIGVNLSGYDDTLRLWKITGGLMTTVLTTSINWQNDIGTDAFVRAEIDRTADGSWCVAVTSSEGEIIDITEGAESEIFKTSWFGIFYRYSSTRDRLLWIDDVMIDGVFMSDTEPPGIVRISPVNKQTLELVLDEEPTPSFLPLTNFSLNGENIFPAEVIKSGQNAYRVHFNTPFVNKERNILTIVKVCDELNNCSGHLSAEFYPVWAEPGDVVITEIMADPIPPVSLPWKEYLELTNTSDYSFQLSGWKIMSDNQVSVFPESEIKGGERAIICSATDTSLFSPFGKVIGLKSLFPLTDAGRTIMLLDNEEDMIHGVEYAQDWYNNRLKEDGGWSLEMIDESYPFNSEFNWEASVSVTGGTPGKTNSVSRNNVDNIFHGILNVFPENDTCLNVTFTEPVRDLESYSGEITIDGEHISSIREAEPLRRKFFLRPGIPLLTGHVYSLEIPETVSDFSGNHADVDRFIFGVPEKARKNDVVFNELLFNPYPGEADYIELYNRSDKIIDVSQLFMVSVNTETGDTSGLFSASETGRCFLPESFYAVTTDRKAVIDRYYSASGEAVHETDQLPAMNNDKGHLILLNRQLDLIDEVRYNEKMHYSLLSGYEGIALEKVNPDASSLDSKNWHSASETCGWGTPGATNSVFSLADSQDNEISLSSTRISPDNDGIEDVLVIGYALPGNDYVLSVYIFDETGTLVNRLAENLLAGQHGSLTWDGTAGDGSLLSRGIYIILVNAYDDKGRTERWKKVCTVIR